MLDLSRPILKRACWFLFAIPLIFVATTHSQDATKLADRLHAADVGSALDASDVKPWHLKMDVQLFDAKGKPADKGTIEEWWVSPELRRITFTMPSYTVTQLHNKDGYFLTKSQVYETPTLDDLLGQIVHPMPHQAEIDDAKPDLRKQKFGKVELDCIMLDQPLKNVAHPPLGLFPTFCLDPDKDSLRFTTELGSLMFMRNRMGLFQGRSVALDVSGITDGIEAISGHITTLEGILVANMDSVPAADMEPITANATKISAGVIAGKALSQPTPVYPVAAKQNHVTGTVVLHAIIGVDGHILSLHIISTPDPDLAIAAVAAVRKWTYKPYLLLGVPTEVETTINVNFAMSP